MPLPISLSQQACEELSQRNAVRHDWIEQLGAQDRKTTSRGYQRVADLQVSTTDPNATLMLTKNGADMGYHTHFVVDGGKARVIIAVLVTPSEVMDDQPMLDLYIPLPDLDHRTEFFSSHAEYQKKTTREIPVVILQPDEA